MVWKVKIKKNIEKTKNAAIIVSLPGIASAGKLAIDYLISELKAKKVGEFISNNGVGFTFINEDNLIELPKIILFHKKIKSRDLFFLTGDYQPNEDKDLYELAIEIISYCEKIKIKEMLTLGGIGLQEEPEKPNIYIATNNKKFRDKLKEFKFNINTNRRVGTIIGITGILIPMAKFDAAAILVETNLFSGHLGFNASKTLIKAIKKIYNFDLKFNNLNKELKLIKKIQDEAMIMLNKEGSTTKQDYIG